MKPTYIPDSTLLKTNIILVGSHLSLLQAANIDTASASSRAAKGGRPAAPTWTSLVWHLTELSSQHGRLLIEAPGSSRIHVPATLTPSICKFVNVSSYTVRVCSRTFFGLQTATLPIQSMAPLSAAELQSAALVASPRSSPASWLARLSHLHLPSTRLMFNSCHSIYQKNVFSLDSDHGLFSRLWQSHFVKFLHLPLHPHLPKKPLFKDRSFLQKASTPIALINHKIGKFAFNDSTQMRTSKDPFSCCAKTSEQ